MKVIEFTLGESEYIQLNQLLKTTGVVYSGGEAKMMILNAMVLVNGEPEDRLRRKIRKDDEVEVDGQKIVIL